MDFEQDWADHRPLSRSSVKLWRTRDCMMNESWKDPKGAEISCAGADRLISGQLTAVASGKTVCGRDQSAGAHGLPLKPLNSPIEHSTHTQTGPLFCLLRFVMAAIESTQVDQFTFPLSNSSFCSNNALWPSEVSHSIYSLNASGSQRMSRPTAVSSRLSNSSR